MLAKPVLVLREVTERPELIDAGIGKIVGTDAERIVEETEAILRNPNVYQAMARKADLFGDGLAAERIVKILSGDLMVPGRNEIGSA